MIKILADASLPLLADCFPPPFALTYYQEASAIRALLADHKVLLCRSTLAVKAPLLAKHALDYVATASSGIDHLDSHYLAQEGVRIIDAKGSNANSVADYVLACLAWLHQQQTSKPVTIGIIGCGATGSIVAQRLRALGFTLLLYDPLRPDFASCSFEQLYTCDVLCIHANLHNDAPHASRNLLNGAFLERLKANTAIINAARGHIVNEQALLTLKQPLIYCSDVFANEPTINPEIIAYAKLCTPHIAGHSIEAKADAVKMLSAKLHHCYQLPPPSFADTPIKPYKINPATWVAQLSALYNPAVESEQMKASPTTQTFITLRKAHQRHDFNLVIEGM